MSFTRFDYDNCRTMKQLQELTGPGRYMLNTPGPGCNVCFYNDPQMRMQKWGANLRHVDGGAPIDIDSDLLGITRKLTKDCTKAQYRHKAKLTVLGVGCCNNKNLLLDYCYIYV